MVRGFVARLDRGRLGRVTKEGSPLLREVLVQCAWIHLQHAKGTRLTKFFWRIARRKGPKVAILTMARKLLVTMYWMLKRGGVPIISRDGDTSILPLRL